MMHGFQQIVTQTERRDNFVVHGLPPLGDEMGVSPLLWRKKLMDSISSNLGYFYDSGSMDIDNVPKPISDALKGLVYLDDEQVTDIVCRKRNLNRELRVENLSLVLAEGFSRGNQFLYIVIEEAPDQEVIY